MVEIILNIIVYGCIIFASFGTLYYRWTEYVKADKKYKEIQKEIQKKIEAIEKLEAEIAIIEKENQNYII